MSSLKRSLYKRLARLVDRPSSPITAQQAAYKDELIEEISRLRSAETGRHDKWDSFSSELVASLKNSPVENFLRWNVISKTMFVSNADYLLPELKFLKQRAQRRPLLSECLTEDSFGHPPPYLFYPKSSGNRIHHTYHVAMYEEVTGKDIKGFDLVFEFGGGYGSMCRVFHKLGFLGKYVIFDLPAFSAIQRFYLRSVGVPVLDADSFAKARQGVLLLSSLEELMAILSSHPESKKLFLATWSLSETPLAMRDALKPLLAGFDSNLIAFQHRFEEIDNLDYFQRHTSERGQLAWKQFNIPSFKGGHSYLFS